MSWLQIALSAIFGVIIATVITVSGSAPATSVAALPSSVPVVIQPATVAATTTPVTTPAELFEKTASSSAPTAPKKTSPVQPAPKPIQQAAATQNTPKTEVPPPTTTTNITAITDMVREAVVNIICTTQASGSFQSISGSGIFIDSRGIILTNSHIAQFFLLKDYPTPGFVTCTIRTGNPAYPRYTAELLFLPPSWMAKNATKINQSDPTGNGEHDYALLYVTGVTGPSVQLPASFPHLAISTDPPQPKQNVLLAAYPAGFLGGITVEKNLYESSAQATVGTLYTFVADTLDLFSIGGTVVSQKGSSGGAVADQNGTLVGLIVTATEDATTASRDLRAISTSYIINDFQKESGVPLGAFLSGDINAEAQQFSLGIAPTLRAELEAAIQNK